jgi:CBS domain containing-hemolysin-like protein
MAVLVPVLIILLLILVNALFVAAEFAIIGVRASRMEQLAEEGNRAAAWVRDTLEHRPKTDSYIATAQLGITLASLGLGMYGEPVVSGLVQGPLHDRLGLDSAIVHSIGFILSLAIITYLHVVIGEMVPKSMALQNAERMALLINVPMRFTEWLFSVPVRLLNGLGLLVLRFIGAPAPTDVSRVYTPDELELIISESSAGGLLEEYEEQLAANIFDFTERRVDQVMTHRTAILAVPVTVTEADLLGLSATSPYSRLPVYEGNLDDVVGMLHLKDFVRQQLSKAPFDLHELMREIPFVPETLPAESLLRSLRKQHQHLAIVLDEHGGTLGLVTLEDLVEEVVGEVRDEFDVAEEEQITVVGPGHLMVLGSVLLEDLEEHVALGTPPHGVQTVGGLMLDKIGGRPKEGDEVKVGDVTFRVQDVDGLTVKHVSIHYPAAAQATEDQAG